MPVPDAASLTYCRSVIFTKDASTFAAEIRRTSRATHFGSGNPDLSPVKNDADLILVDGRNRECLAIIAWQQHERPDIAIKPAHAVPVPEALMQVERIISSLDPLAILGLIKIVPAPSFTVEALLIENGEYKCGGHHVGFRAAHRAVAQQRGTTLAQTHPPELNGWMSL